MNYWITWKNHPSLGYTDNPREEYRKAWRNQRLYSDTLVWHEAREYCEPALAPYKAAAKQSYIDRFAQRFRGSVTHSGQLTNHILQRAKRGESYYIPEGLRKRLVEKEQIGDGIARQSSYQQFCEDVTNGLYGDAYQRHLRGL